MRTLLFVTLLICFTTSAASLSLDIDTSDYVFHCEGEEPLCGGELTGNYTLRVVEAHEFYGLYNPDFGDKDFENVTKSASLNEVEELQTPYKNGSEPSREYMEDLRRYKNLEESLELFRKQREKAEEREDTEEVSSLDEGIKMYEQRMKNVSKNLTEYENVSYLVSKAAIDRWNAPVKVTYKDDSGLHEEDLGYADTRFDFYPKSSYSREELKVGAGCRRTNVKEVGDFYHVGWYITFEPDYCIRRNNLVSGAPDEVINKWKNPLGYALYRALPSGLAALIL